MTARSPLRFLLIATLVTPAWPAAAAPPPAPTAAATPTAAEWHVTMNGQTSGPFTRDALADMIARGTITASTLVWREGAAGWTELSVALPELVPAPAPAPPAAVPAPVAPRDHDSPTAQTDVSDEKAAMLEKSRKLRLGGVVTLTVGASLVVIGGGLCGGYSTGAVSARVMWAGVGLAVVGLVPVGIGAGLLVAGNRKGRKAAALARVSPTGWAGRGTAGIGLQGRF